MSTEPDEQAVARNPVRATARQLTVNDRRGDRPLPCLLVTPTPTDRFVPLDVGTEASVARGTHLGAIAAGGEVSVPTDPEVRRPFCRS